MMTTRPFLFLGDTLLLNADASQGSIAVEALDAAGKSIAGFGLAGIAAGAGWGEPRAIEQG